MLNLFIIFFFYIRISQKNEGIYIYLYNKGIDGSVVEEERALFEIRERWSILFDRKREVRKNEKKGIFIWDHLFSENIVFLI